MRHGSRPQRRDPFLSLERHFHYLAKATPTVEEALLIPFSVAGETVGAIWVITPDSGRRFDAEDLRVMTNLGNFAAAAYQAQLSRGTIAERKEAEAALAHREREFRTLADNMSQFAWMTDAAGWIYWYNQRWFDYTGTTLEEFPGPEPRPFALVSGSVGEKALLCDGRHSTEVAASLVNRSSRMLVHESQIARVIDQIARVIDMNAMIQIRGPENGNFVAQFLTRDGRSLAILVPEAQADVLRELQEHMPYGLVVRNIVEAACEGV